MRSIKRDPLGICGQSEQICSSELPGLLDTTRRSTVSAGVAGWQLIPQEFKISVIERRIKNLIITWLTENIPPSADNGVLKI